MTQLPVPTATGSQTEAALSTATPHTDTAATRARADKESNGSCRSVNLPCLGANKKKLCDEAPICRCVFAMQSCTPSLPGVNHGFMRTCDSHK